MKCKALMSAIAMSVSLLVGATAAPAALATSVPYAESYSEPIYRTVNLSALSSRPSVVLAVCPATQPGNAGNYELVMCIDFCGNLWQFYSDAGDWCVSDGCDLLLLDISGTADITDDQIIGATYVRYDLLPAYDLD